MTPVRTFWLLLSALMVTVAVMLGYIVGIQYGAALGALTTVALLAVMFGVPVLAAAGRK